jgi:hypothetical protein
MRYSEWLNRPVKILTTVKISQDANLCCIGRIIDIGQDLTLFDNVQAVSILTLILGALALYWIPVRKLLQKFRVLKNFFRS